MEVNDNEVVGGSGDKIIDLFKPNYKFVEV